jgi:tetratricopeptide (TPR) repeat protein
MQTIVITGMHPVMHVLTRIPALGLALGLALTTTSCSYFRQEAATKLYNKGVELQKQNSLDEAAAAYDELIDKYTQDTQDPAILKVVCTGMHNRAVILHKQLNFKRTIAFSDKIIATCGSDSREEIRSKVAAAMYSKAVVYEMQNQLALAIPVQSSVVETYSRDTWPETRRTVTAAMNNLGFDQLSANQVPESVSTFRHLLGSYATDPDPEIRGQCARALFGLGIALQQGQQFQEAVASYRQLIDTYASGNTAVTRNLVMRGLSQLAQAYQDLKQPRDAETAYIRLITTYGPGKTPDERLLVTHSGLKLGAILREQHQTAASVKVYDDLISAYSGDAGNEMRAILAEALQNKALAVEDQSLDDALVIFEQVVKTYGADNDASINWTVGYSLNAAAYKRLLIAKRGWADRARTLNELQAAQSELNASLARIPNRSWTLGNLAYVQWLLGEHDTAEKTFAIGLNAPKDGGATLYKDTLGDIAKFPIREDKAFRSMIDRQWLRYGAEHPGNS